MTELEFQVGNIVELLDLRIKQSKKKLERIASNIQVVVNNLENFKLEESEMAEEDAKKKTTEESVEEKKKTDQEAPSENTAD